MIAKHRFIDIDLIHRGSDRHGRFQSTFSSRTQHWPFKCVYVHDVWDMSKAFAKQTSD